jgi:hypothetical protein
VLSRVELFDLRLPPSTFAWLRPRCSENRGTPTIVKEFETFRFELLDRSSTVDREPGLEWRLKQVLIAHTRRQPKLQSLPFLQEKKKVRAQQALAAHAEREKRSKVQVTFDLIGRKVRPPTLSGL